MSTALHAPSSGEMTLRAGSRSPRRTARLAGALYAASGVPAGFSIFVLMKLIVRGNPAATAARILSAETLFRLAYVAEIIGVLLFVSSVLLLYEIFKPVSRRLALMVLILGLIGSTVQVLDSVADMAALILLKGGATLAALPAAQGQALAFVLLRLHFLIYDLALMFYGVFAILIGRLVLRSTFLPRVIGVLMTIDGLGYLTVGLSTFLVPAFAAHLFPFLPFMTAILGEGSLMGWLIVKGVDAVRWKEQAAAARRKDSD